MMIKQERKLELVEQGELEDVVNKVINDFVEGINSSVREGVVYPHMSTLQRLHNISRFNNTPYSYVYFLKNQQNGLTKIGSTKNLRSRISQIRRDFINVMGEKPQLKIQGLILCMEGKERNVEKMMHEEFVDTRVHGEWFDLSDEDMLYDIIGAMYSVYDIPLGVWSDVSDSEDVLKEKLSIYDIEKLSIAQEAVEHYADAINAYRRFDRLGFFKKGNSKLVNLINNIYDCDNHNFSLIDEFDKVDTDMIKQVTELLKN